ncbi:MAG TPA: cytochrome c oxidase subunit II [Solirubrobacteraceae bacterium]|nr:cytochrome c oxidase subunit II [Solirubrobacteraceae bacterium]
MGGGGDTRGPYEQLESLYLPVAAIVFVLVALALVVVAVRFRARAGAQPSKQMSAPRLEIAYAVGLAIVAGLLLWRSFEAMSDSDPVVARAAPAAGAGTSGLTIGIVASRWNWRVSYPGGVVQTGDGRTRPATLVVPSGQPVRFELTSRDVVHALWVPELRAKYDAMPGYTNVFDLRFTAGADYDTVRCSEFCGDLHDRMLLRIDAREPAAFDAWLRNRRQAVTR